MRLPDDTLAEVQWSSFAEVHVIHAYATFGRGPWIFARHKVELATEVERAAYAEAVIDHERLMRRARAHGALVLAPA